MVIPMIGRNKITTSEIEVRVAGYFGYRQNIVVLMFHGELIYMNVIY